MEMGYFHNHPVKNSSWVLQILKQVASKHYLSYIKQSRGSGQIFHVIKAALPPFVIPKYHRALFKLIRSQSQVLAHRNLRPWSNKVKLANRGWLGSLSLGYQICPHAGNWFAVEGV